MLSIKNYCALLLGASNSLLQFSFALIVLFKHVRKDRDVSLWEKRRQKFARDSRLVGMSLPSKKIKKKKKKRFPMERVDSACGKCECNRNSLIPSTTETSDTHIHTHIHREKARRAWRLDVTLPLSLDLYPSTFSIACLSVHRRNIERERERERKTWACLRKRERI